jgi:hypothetical protein
MDDKRFNFDRFFLLIIYSVDFQREIKYLSFSSLLAVVILVEVVVVLLITRLVVRSVEMIPFLLLFFLPWLTGGLLTAAERPVLLQGDKNKGIIR